MDSITPKMLRETIAAHPRSSLQDALLLFVLMTAILLLALQYDLFFFVERLSAAERKISLAEAITLTLLMTAGLVVFILRRIGEQKRDAALLLAAETELHKLTTLAMHDPLTGLPNRRALLSALTAAVDSPPSNGTKHALFMIDLNHFKEINDAYGHSVGDQILEVVADRFRGAARPSDLVARIGGDEFAVLAYNVDEESVQDIGVRFVESLSRSIRTERHAHSISMAIGVALIPDDGVTAEEVLDKADTAMYRAKELGCSFVLFDPAIEAKKQIA